MKNNIEQKYRIVRVTRNNRKRYQIEINFSDENNDEWHRNINEFRTLYFARKFKQSFIEDDLKKSQTGKVEVIE